MNNKNETEVVPQISFFEKSVYGNPLLYPLPDRSKTFLKLTGKKTATPLHIEALRELGFAVMVLRPETGFETLLPINKFAGAKVDNSNTVSRPDIGFETLLPINK